MRFILFAFYGRRENVEIQLPYLRRILDEHPNVEVHLWDLCHNRADHKYLQGIAGDRITVRANFYDLNAWNQFGKVWRHYASEEYADCLFGKIDDDVVFIETDRFGDFINAIDHNRGSVVSAKTINNGASTRLEYAIWQRFASLGIPLLDVHASAEYARLCHEYFRDQWRTACGQPLQIFPTDDWLSINLIGMDHPTLRSIADALGSTGTGMIAGRDCNGWPEIGDEGAANMLPRLILQGFAASHLSFGPQKMSVDEWNEMRHWYARIAEEHLA